MKPGRVSLVGAGPGDPGLLTVRALERLREAEVVVYDRLVNPELLDEAPAEALRIFAGKRVGSHCLPQAAINAHRGIASSFAVLTGHEDPAKDGDATDWRKLATAVDTLVILMAIGSFPRIVAALLAHGRRPETPVALIRWGTTEAQEVRVGTLADIVGHARGLEPPVVAVVGDVVSLREQLAWSVVGQDRERAVQQITPNT